MKTYCLFQKTLICSLLVASLQLLVYSNEIKDEQSLLILRNFVKCFVCEQTVYLDSFGKCGRVFHLRPCHLVSRGRESVLVKLSFASLSVSTVQLPTVQDKLVTLFFLRN